MLLLISNLAVTVWCGGGFGPGRGCEHALLIVHRLNLTLISTRYGYQAGEGGVRGPYYLYGEGQHKGHLLRTFPLLIRFNSYLAQLETVSSRQSRWRIGGQI